MTTEATSAGGQKTQGKIVATLREAIRQGLLEVGTQLVQADLAQALNVSRVPVREALQYLASEGLVVFTDQGVRVTSLTVEEVDELWSFRAVVEPPMAKKIVAHMGPKDYQDLEEMVAAMDDIADLQAWLDLNYHFHTRLYELAKSPYFARAATNALTLIGPHTRISVIGMGRREISQAEHHQMLRALESADAKALSELFRLHCLRPKQELLEWSRRQDDTITSAKLLSEEAKAFAARLGGPKPKDPADS